MFGKAWSYPILACNQNVEIFVRTRVKNTWIRDCKKTSKGATKLVKDTFQASMIADWLHTNFIPCSCLPPRSYLYVHTRSSLLEHACLVQQNILKHTEVPFWNYCSQLDLVFGSAIHLLRAWSRTILSR